MTRAQFAVTLTVAVVVGVLGTFLLSAIGGRPALAQDDEPATAAGAFELQVHQPPNGPVILLLVDTRSGEVWHSTFRGGGTPAGGEWAALEAPEPVP